MDQVIVFRNQDGSCEIVVPAPKAALPIEAHIILAQPLFRELALENEKPEDTYNRVGEAKLQAIKPFRVTTRNKIPSDRHFRNAWTDDFDTDTVDVHMDRAREHHVANIRKQRNSQWPDLDARYVAAQRDSLDLGPLEEERQRLKAAPTKAAELAQAASSPEELKAIRLEDL